VAARYWQSYRTLCSASVISVKAPVLMRISAPIMMNTIGTSQERVLHRQQWIDQHSTAARIKSLDYGLEL
jgi:hypothetical protein